MTTTTTSNHDLTFNAYQYADFKSRGQDAYANAKYDILAKWIAKGGANRDILNAGCGSGEFSFLLGSQGHRVEGIDPGPEYVELAKTQAEQLGFKNLTFSVAGIEDFAAANAGRQYDAVIATDVIEHIKDDVAAVRAMLSLLTPGGDLFITVPAGPKLFGYHDEQLGHYRRYTLKMCRDVLPDGVHLHKLRYFGMCLVPIAWHFSVKKRKNYPVAEAGDGKSMPIASRIMHALFAVEKKVGLPWGTSCLMWAKKD
ncbi:MAG TPA: class I SAM-dependent methyltransferase [Tepidisphaeraceae bacterium]|jgi:SAM-dependent methyltransferase|nr:class I SAM-dependent methyltransferase [Tepidisphaeraceae bacterium]